MATMREIEDYCQRNPSFTYESAREALHAKEDREYGYARSRMTEETED